MRLLFLLLLCCSFLSGHAQTEDETARRNSELRLLRARAVKGNVEAQLKLGKMHFKGEGIPRNDDEAAIWIRKAALQGNAEAQYYLAVFYANGLGVSKDQNEAVKWARASADQGYVAATSLIGTYHEQGEILPKNDASAVAAYRKAAEQGFGIAQYNLSFHLRTGAGTEKERGGSCEMVSKSG